MKKLLYIVTAVAFFFISISPAPGFAFSVNVLQGDASVSTNGNTVTITATGRAILQGNTSIPAGITVKVVQGLNDILLRDTTGTATNILGSLFSNGNIILINAMGVYIGQSANINVGGLIASTLNIQNQLFMSGTYQFSKILGLNPAQILNDANITVAPGGYVILLADRVVNNGTITAYMGSVALGSGQQATVSFDQGGLVNLVINQGLVQQLTDSSGNPQAQIVNNGAIRANGGKIQMTAQLLETTFAGIMNNTGIIEANNVVLHDGFVELTASGAIDNSGTISTSLLNESGSAFRSTGTLELGQGYFDNLDGAISDLSGNVEGIITDTGDIDLGGDVNLIGDLTLHADSQFSDSGEIVMNGYSVTGHNYNLTLYSGENETLDGAITGINILSLNSTTANNVTYTSSSEAFSIKTMQTNVNADGGDAFFSRAQGSGTSRDPYMIYSDSPVLGGLQDIGSAGQSLSAYYKLANNIDASDTLSWGAGDTAGFNPIATFTGNFNGRGDTISNLFINRPSTSYVGLFGLTSGATIENVSLVNVNITGLSAVGGLVGFNYLSTIDNSDATGNVAGSYAAGGLVGFNNLSTIDNSYATGAVEGVIGGGGLVGINENSFINNSYFSGDVSGLLGTGGLVGYNSNSSISRSYASGNVSGEDAVGGLVGLNVNSIITGSYAAGDVSGGVVGGLVGYNISSSIDDSYATGNVTGVAYNGVADAGGLVGYSVSSSIDNSYAKGNITGNADNIGGLVGYNSQSSIIDNSYAAGSVSGINNVGGLAGNSNSSSIDSSYATGSVNGSQDVGGLVGYNNFVSLINNSFATGSVNGGSDVGGLVGQNFSSTIDNSYATGNVTGAYDDIGGLVGKNCSGPYASAVINNSYATGNVTGTVTVIYGFDTGNNVGGLVGYNDGWNSGSVNPSIVDNSYATGVVNGSYNVGGLVGYNYQSSIDNSYATGMVAATGESYGNSNAGGLAGWNRYSTIDNSYAVGNVTGTGNNVGGLVGYNKAIYSQGTNIFYPGIIDNSYATGTVSGNANAGGLVGKNSNLTDISNSFATGVATSTSDADASAGGFIGYDQATATLDNNYWYNTANAAGIASGLGSGNANVSKANAVSDFYDTGSGTGGAVYSSWDFTNIWVETNTYPILRFNWTGLLTFRQLEELRIGLPFELTGQDHNNAEIIVFEHQTGEDQNNIYGSGIGHLQEADHAVQQPWGVELESL